jgi:lysophospholipase L1-like esterase
VLGRGGRVYACRIMLRRHFQQLLLLTLTGISAVTQAQTGAASAARPTLVIIGASYAAGLKQPALARYAVTNKGVGGEDMAQVAARFDRDVLAAQPAAVIIWGHINSIHRASVPMEQLHANIKADYEKMVAAAQVRGIRVILATETTLPKAYGFTNKIMSWIGGLRGKEGYSARVNREVNVLNDWLRSYARSHQLTLLDFEKALDDGDGFRRDEFTSEDGTHVNDAGYVQLTRVMQAELNR